ncbi:AAA family ATPase [Methylobacterium variabile]|nr:AAA family ATPase [Methylobacterium variabile]
MTPTDTQDGLPQGGVSHDDLARAARMLARLEAARDRDRADLAARTRAVAAAKGRLAQRDAVDTYLRELQQDANRRSVATFETLLTALVREVLPGEKPVRLDLTTERGLPALDIAVERPDGGREDVLEDNGGAMTNVVGMALRLIAVVKAGVGRFLALDEADCWIAPDRVPAFYRVLDDGAARLGVQCLAISHHDVAGFDAGLTVSRIAGRPETGVAIDGSAASCAAAWSPEMPGFRFVRLVDVQGFSDATLPLSPGVNALVGPNNHGKSTVIRALRAVFYGEVRDSLVRAGASAARVEIGVAGGRILRYVRQPRRTPVNLWSLHEADGSLVQENGATLETGGRDVPSWVERLFGITRVEELDVHVAHQKFPVFLLGEKPARRSAVLSIGREAGLIRDMQALQRERVTEDQRTVREGEREITRLRERLGHLDGLDALAEALQDLRAQAVSLDAEAARLRDREALRDRLARAARLAAGAAARASALAALPGPEIGAELGRALAEARHREAVGRRVLGGARDLAAAQARLAALAELPREAPVPRDSRAATAHAARLRRLTRDLADAEGRAALLETLPDAAPQPVLRPDAAATARRLAEIGRRLAEARARADAARDGLAATEAAMAEVLAATGGRCPACGTPTAPAALLAGHRHGTRPEEAA